MTMVLDGSLGVDLVKDGAVTTSKMASGAVTNNELSTAVKPIGAGQTWQTLTGSRSLGTTYTNSTGRPIQVIVSLSQANNGIGHQVYVDSQTFNAFQCNGGASGITSSSSFIVPDGKTYYVLAQTGESIGSWSELR